MISVIFRTTIMFILVMFVLRIMGKKNLGEFQPSDFVSTMLISNLTSIVIEAPELPLMYSVVPILLIMCYEIFTSILAKKDERIAKLAYGTPKILILDGVIDQYIMKQLRFTVDDILEAMRSKDIFYLEEVKLAVVETTGAINIYPDPESKTNINKAPLPPFDIIVDGKERFYNLKYINTDIKKIESILIKENLSAENVLLLLVDSKEQYNLTKKEIV